MRELIVDLFAGGGGASEGIRRALGVAPDIAVNHDAEAIAMHAANHVLTEHLTEDVFKVNPLEAVKGKPVGLLWASPDCTQFSRAKGGKPVKKENRFLAWAVVHWAQLVRPRVIILENVSEFAEWGPLDERDKPVVSKKGKTFHLWANQLRGLGYKVEHRVLAACDYGAPTIRKRLFVIARCDGEPITWPEPTHAEPGNVLGLKPYRTAAECIDFSIPCPSIFLTPNDAKRLKLNVRRPLAEKTMQRIARGIKRYVIEAQEPFIIGIDHRGSNGGCVWGASEPLRTITHKNRFAVIAPSVIKYHGLKGSEARGQRVDEPVKTLDTSNRFALVSAFLSKYFGGVTGADLRTPAPTVTAIDHNALAAVRLTKLYNTNIGSDMAEPVPTITGGGQHIGQVRAFLIKYYGTNIGHSMKEPMHTVTSKDRLGLVTVAGEQYQIADIGLRMLTPRELARAQGFGDDYILTGTKSNKVAKIGNSVCPDLAEAIVGANVEVRESRTAESA
jgi:DNA (cytosine-5)-methyltransferase 1